MWAFDAFCDEFCLASRLFLKLELSPSRESLLQFCEVVRRAFPAMVRFRRREDGSIMLDEEAAGRGGRRYLRMDASALRVGQFSPPSGQGFASFAGMVLSHAPYYLSLSDLDYDSLEVVYGFDLEYCGNHDELVAETLLGDNPLHAAMTGDNRRIIDCQPCVGVGLDEECRTQAYLEIRGRTSMHEIRSTEYETQALSVYLTLRREFRDDAPRELTGVQQELLELGEELATGRVVPHIVRRLREAIASRR